MHASTKGGLALELFGFHTTAKIAGPGEGARHTTQVPRERAVLQHRRGGGGRSGLRFSVRGHGQNTCTKVRSVWGSRTKSRIACLAGAYRDTAASSRAEITTC